MDCTADLLLVFVWDKTASGTARSKTENRQPKYLVILIFTSWVKYVVENAYFKKKMLIFNTIIVPLVKIWVTK